MTRLLHTLLLVCFVLGAHAALAQDTLQVADVPVRNWATAPRHSAGIAPDPDQLDPLSSAAQTRSFRAGIAA